MGDNVKKKYLLYGDDKREEVADLDELAQEADRLLATKTKKTVEHSDLEDISQEIVPLADDPPIIEEEERDDTKEESKKEEGQPKKKRPIRSVLIILLLIIGIASMVSVIRQTPNEPVAKEPSVTEPKEDHKENNDAPKKEQEEKVNEHVQDNEEHMGYLKPVQKTETYTVSDTLSFAKKINDTTKDYLMYAVDLITEIQEGKTVDLKTALGTKKKMLDYDIENITTYETMFDTYHGGDYIRAAEDRIKNVQAMYEAVVQEYPSITDLVHKTNEFIANENIAAQKSKDTLVAYLDANNVSYHMDDSQISYDELQFNDKEGAQ